MMAQADFSQLLQFLSGPYSPHRIMRIAQDEQLYLLLLDLAFKVFIIYAVLRFSRNCFFFVYQCIVYYLTVVVTDNIGKRIIDRILDQYRVSRLCESLYRCAQCKYHTGGLHDPFSLRLPVMVLLHPVRYSIIIGILGLGVSVDSMIHCRIKTLCNFIRYRKIHVCDPQRQHIRRLASLHGIVVLQAVRAFTICNFIKIVCSHTNPLTFRQPANILPVAPGCKLNFSISRTHSSRTFYTSGLAASVPEFP